MTVTALSKLSEAGALDWFWRRHRDGDDMRELLALMSEVRIARADGWRPDTVRTAHRAAPRTFARPVRCQLCAAEGRTFYRHHIIGIAHGGSNTRRNQIPLCGHCHRLIHPWLGVRERYEFEQVAAVSAEISDAIVAGTVGRYFPRWR